MQRSRRLTASAQILGDGARPESGTSAQVVDALAHLYDTGHLQTHSLARTLEDGGPSAGRTLRRALLDAIEHLRPERGAPWRISAKRQYALLKLRYVEGLDAPAVQARLAIAKSQYYRDHARAVAAVADLLRERWADEPARVPSRRASGSAGRLMRQTPLPRPLTSFVGRARELSELERLLADARLVTLTGPPGTGKTRLATVAATAAAARFPDGATFVALAPVSDPELVLPTIARAFGLQETPGRSTLELLGDALRQRQLLMVLDNFEQVTAAAPLLVELLAESPTLTLLVTSREPLRVTGEQVFAVPPLAVPPDLAPGGPVPAESLAYDAVQLFIERARAAHRDFSLTKDSAAPVVEICRRLDGLPLAIELAAARTRTLPPAELMARLESRFTVLTGGARDVPHRHQTLLAAIDWSYQLLSEPERRLLRRLAVFAGGLTVDAAEAVCADAPQAPAGPPSPIDRSDVLELLACLVDRSLLVAEQQDGAARYRLLETIREYSSTLLAETDEPEAIARRHAEFYAGMAEEAEPMLLGPDAAGWLDRLAREHDNFRAVMRWCVERRVVEPGLRLAGALYMFWYFRSQWSESRSALAKLLALPEAAGRTQLRARALFSAGWLAIDQGENEEARHLCEESLAIGREIGDEGCVARALVVIGLTHHYHGDNAGARPPLQEALALGRSIGDQWAVEVALMHLGTAYFLFDADYTAACAAFGENLALARASGNRWVMAHALEWLGNTMFEQEDHAAARGYYQEALAVNRQLGDQLGVAHVQQRIGLVCLEVGEVSAARALLMESLLVQCEIGDVPYVTMTFEGLAGVAAADFPSDGDGTAVARRALRLAGFAKAHRELHNPPLSSQRQARLDRWLAPARRAVSEEVAAVVWAEGRAMTLDEAIAYALADY